MIITHSDNGRMSDFLAVTLASYAMGDTHINCIKHADVKDAIKNMSELDVMVDIGGILDPQKRIFDHNHNKDLDAAFVHIAKFFKFKLPENSLWQYFSDVDTKGPVKAREIHDISLVEVEFIYKSTQLILKTWDLVFSEGTINTDMFIRIGAALDMHNFDLDGIHLMAIRSIVREIYPDKYSEANEQIAQEKKQKERAIKSLVFTEINNYKIAINNSGIYLSHTDTGTPIILTPNVLNNKPSLVVNTEVIHVTEVLDLLNKPTTTFIHPDGFLAFLDDSWEYVINMLPW